MTPVASCRAHSPGGGSVDFTILAVIVLAGLVGPILAYPRGWHVPVVVGELLVGIILGHTGLRYLNASNPTFSFLAEVGFGLVMFVAGTHVPVRDVTLQRSLGRGGGRAALVGAGSAVLGVLLDSAFGTGHDAMYAVLMASSSPAPTPPASSPFRVPSTPRTQAVPGWGHLPSSCPAPHSSASCSSWNAGATATGSPWCPRTVTLLTSCG